MPTGELLDVSEKKGRYLTSCELNRPNTQPENKQRRIDCMSVGCMHEQKLPSMSSSFSFDSSFLISSRMSYK